MHFTKFLSNRGQTSDNIIPLLSRGKVSVYELLDQFISYLIKAKISSPTLKVYIAVIRSFLEYYDIDISNAKFKKKVKMPRYFADPEEPLSLSDIRTLLEYNSNHRLRTYILLLVSSGMRAMEAASLRLQDVDFTTSPTRITIRREYSKTKRVRTIYCSDEATKHLQKLIEIHSIKAPNDLIFSVHGSTQPITIYNRILEQFEKLQKVADKDQRKEGSKRRKITLHSFRRTNYSIIAENCSSDFANFYLGHHHSSYWTHKESERHNIYRTKCMPFLTVYQDTRNNTIEEALKIKDKAIQTLQSQQNGLMDRIDNLEALLADPEKYIRMRDDAFAMGRQQQEQQQKKK
jgi:integrase